MKLLDAEEWTVVIDRYAPRVTPDGMTVDYAPGDAVTVQAASMEIGPGGALVFRDSAGRLVKTFGPNGYLEVEVAQR